jgi:D-alanyl-D-alanine carboxypeptidase
MKKLLTVLTVFCFVVFFSAGCRDEKPGDPQYQSKLQDMLDSGWTKYGSDKTNWGGGVAMRILSPKGNFFISTEMGEGVTEHIHFRGASTTKTFTGASILLLQQRGMLNIDNVITDLIPGTSQTYVPDTPDYAIPYKSEITIRLLLEHRAGVFDVANNPVPSTARAPYAGQYYITYVREDLGEDDHTFTFDELVGVVASNGLYFTPPGTEFHYSDTGYSLLGKIIERVSGKKYDIFVQDNFLTPNSLSKTSFPYEGSDQSIPSPYAEGYIWFDNTLYNVTQDNMSPHTAEGNVISAPLDLAEWVKRLLRSEAGLDEEYVEMMMDCRPTGESHQYYGLGCVFTPGLGYGHNGGHIGYLTVMRYDPDFDVALVIFASVFNANDLQGQSEFLYELGYSAREILGYPVQ